jgi:hypothetical protein
LTINPETGLAEAGFLDKLMPMIVGAGLAYATGGMSLGAELGLAGVSNAAVIGGGIGALETARTGNLGKGIMSGLGAYGGAGLGGAAESAGMFNGAETVPAAPNLAGPTALHPNMVGPDTSPIFSDAIGADTEQLASSLPKGNLLANPLTPQPPSMGELIMQNKGYAAAGAAPAIMDAMSPNRAMPEKDTGMIRPYRFDYNPQTPTNMIGATRQDGQDTSERTYFQPKFTPLPPYKAAGGGLMSLAGGGPVEQMSNANAIGANTGYPMADINKAAYATPYQTPMSQNVVQGAADTGVNSMTGEQNRFAGGGNVQLQGRVTIDDQGGGQGANGYQAAGSNIPGFGGGTQQPQGGQGGMMGGLDPRAIAANPQGFQQFMQGAQQQEMQRPGSTMFGPTASLPTSTLVMAQGGMAYAQGGISSLGGYSDGGRLLKGPGDGMSDNIPAQIGSKQPARLADGEFVVPADVVSHLGNGSTDAGAKQLYKMMDRIRAQRTGKKKQAPEVNPAKAMPA